MHLSYEHSRYLTVIWQTANLPTELVNLVAERYAFLSRIAITAL